MADVFTEPILNSSDDCPGRREIRMRTDSRPAESLNGAGGPPITPLPKPPKDERKKTVQQRELALGEVGISTVEQVYIRTPINNEVCNHLDPWRQLPSRADWGVTPRTAWLLIYWRHYTYYGIPPFPYKVKAAEGNLTHRGRHPHDVAARTAPVLTPSTRGRFEGRPGHQPPRRQGNECAIGKLDCL